LEAITDLQPGKLDQQCGLRIVNWCRLAAGQETVAFGHRRLHLLVSPERVRRVAYIGAARSHGSGCHVQSLPDGLPNRCCRPSSGRIFPTLAIEVEPPVVAGIAYNAITIFIGAMAAPMIVAIRRGEFFPVNPPPPAVEAAATPTSLAKEPS
jgi:hypothetical protein